MADIKTGKKKPYATISTGMIGSKASGGDAIERKVASDWNPGKSKFAKRSGKGHNLNRYATRKLPQ